jgi:cytochrome c-type biogenesis protein CcmE
MPTKKVKNRILFLIVAASIFLLFIFFVLKTLNKNLLYFSTPTDVIKNDSLMIGIKKKLNLLLQIIIMKLLLVLRGQCPIFFLKKKE